MSIDDLKTFVVLYEKRNFTDAAFELNVGQSTLSKRIKSMADELNVRLVATRNKRHVRITEDGELLYRFATDTIGKYDQLQKRIEEIHQLERGKLRISYTCDALNSTVLSKINQIMAELPGIKFNFRLVTYQELNKLMFNDDIDIIIANGVDDFQNEFDFYHVCKNQIGIFSERQLDLNSKDLMLTSVADKYVNNFDNHNYQIFPSIQLISEYLKFNEAAAAVLPVSIVNDQMPLLKLVDDDINTALIVPKNRDQRPIVKYVVQKFTVDHLNND